MSRRQLEPVPNCADLVEEYTKKYPQTERRALRKLILLKYSQINPRTLDRHLKKAYSQHLENALRFPTTKQGVAAKPKPVKHVLEIASGLLALCNVTKYRIEGRPYPKEEFREHALMHIKTGYLPIFKSVLEMAKRRPVCFGPNVKKTDECMDKYKQAREAFNNETNILIQRLDDGIDELATSWCKTCEVIQSKTISAEEEAEVRNLLKVVWDVAV